MPARPYWLKRLPEIIGQLQTLSAESIDRSIFQSIFQLRRRRAIELMHLLGSRKGQRGFVLDRLALLDRLTSSDTLLQFEWEMCGSFALSAGQTNQAVINPVHPQDGTQNGHRKITLEFTDDGELVEKVLALLRSTINNRMERGTLEAAAVGRNHQYNRFEMAIKAFWSQQYSVARGLFAQAFVGADERIRTAAEQYMRMCSNRIDRGAGSDSFERHYIYGVALSNAGRLVDARKHFEIALQINDRADYVYYALAACMALNHDIAGTRANLGRAIELQPRNRTLVAYDPDFQAVLDDPTIRRLL